MTEDNDEARLREATERNARNTIDYLLQWGLATLMAERSQIPAPDRQLLEKALQNLRLNFDEFAEASKSLRSTAPTRTAHLFGLVGEMVSAAVVLGGVGLFAPNARQFYQEPFREEKRNAGRRGGELRRREADEGWRPHALELAHEIQAEEFWHVTGEPRRGNRQTLAAENPVPENATRKSYPPMAGIRQIAQTQ